MTQRADGNRTAAGFGFETQMRRADFTAFPHWYDRRCLLGRPDRAEIEVSLSAPAGPASTPRAAAQMRDAA